MKINEIYTVNMMNQAKNSLLRTTDDHIKHARSSKFQIIAIIPPMDFLKLSSPKGYIDEFLNSNQGIHQYNKYIKTGENIIMPFLSVDIPSGRIKGHEGRNRAGAIINAGGKHMKIALELRPSRDYEPQTYTDEVAQHGFQLSNIEYHMTQKDLPNVLYGQYTREAVSTQGWHIDNGDLLGKYRKSR